MNKKPDVPKAHPNEVRVMICRFGARPSARPIMDQPALLVKSGQSRLMRAKIDLMNESEMPALIGRLALEPRRLKPPADDCRRCQAPGQVTWRDAGTVPVTGPNRIPYLLTNKVDVLIATFGITADRSKQVLFSNPYSSLTIYVLAR